MKKTKLFTLIPLTLSILVLVSACSKQEEPQTPSGETPIAEKQVIPHKTDNASAEPAKNSEVVPMEKAVTGTTETLIEEPTSKALQNEQSTSLTTANTHKEQLALAQKSGCLACHAIDKKVVGPAWRDVSTRYKDEPDAKARLMAKVSKGGRGNWTEVVGTAAMPPYSPRVSDENIALLVEFILSLEQ